MLFSCVLRNSCPFLGLLGWDLRLDFFVFSRWCRILWISRCGWVFGWRVYWVCQIRRDRGFWLGSWFRQHRICLRERNIGWVIFCRCFWGRRRVHWIPWGHCSRWRCISFWDFLYLREVLPEEFIHFTYPMKVDFPEFFFALFHSEAIKVDVEFIPVENLEGHHLLNTLEIGVDGHIKIRRIEFLHIPEFLLKLGILFALDHDIDFAEEGLLEDFVQHEFIVCSLQLLKIIN